MIYLLRNNNFLKIGFAKDVQRRMKCYNTCAFGYQLLDVRDGDKQVEKLLHRMFKKYQVAKEWFEDNDYIISHFHDSVEELVKQTQNSTQQRRYIRVWTSRGVFYKDFDSIQKCSESLGVSIYDIKNALTNKKTKVKNFIIQHKVCEQNQFNTL